MRTIITTIVFLGISAITFGQELSLRKPYNPNENYYKKVINNPLVTEKLLNKIVEKMTAHSRKLYNTPHKQQSKKEILEIFIPKDSTQLNSSFQFLDLLVDIFPLEKTKK